MATYEKIDDDTVEITIEAIVTTASKKDLERELALLDNNIAHKIALRDEVVKKLNVFK